jgi:hypothetical protein
MAAKETANLYDTILKSADLNSEVKLHSKVNGRLALYLVMSLECSMTNDDPKNPLGRVLSEEDKGAMESFIAEILTAGKLQTFHDILRKFAAIS